MSRSLPASKIGTGTYTSIRRTPEERGHVSLREQHTHRLCRPTTSVLCRVRTTSAREFVLDNSKKKVSERSAASPHASPSGTGQRASEARREKYRELSAPPSRHTTATLASESILLAAAAGPRSAATEGKRCKTARQGKTVLAPAIAVRRYVEAVSVGRWPCLYRP